MSSRARQAARATTPPLISSPCARRFGGAYIANNAYTRELAIETLQAGRADLIAFGKLFISNPDLVERLREDAPLNAPHQETFYGGDALGYTDYPALGDA